MSNKIWHVFYHIVSFWLYFYHIGNIAFRDDTGKTGVSWKIVTVPGIAAQFLKDTDDTLNLFEAFFILEGMVFEDFFDLF